MKNIKFHFLAEITLSEKEEINSVKSEIIRNILDHRKIFIEYPNGESRGELICPDEERHIPIDICYHLEFNYLFGY